EPRRGAALVEEHRTLLVVVLREREILQVELAAALAARDRVCLLRAELEVFDRLLEGVVLRTCVHDVLPFRRYRSSMSAHMTRRGAAVFQRRAWRHLGGAACSLS